MNILDRYKKPTPKFFRILRNIATAAGTILAVPIQLPPNLLSLATYLLIIGTVVGALCQAAVEDPPQKNGLSNPEDPINLGEEKQNDNGL